MNERRTFLKALAQRSADAWSTGPTDAALRGETRIETRNTIYKLRDGVCVAVMQRRAAPGRADAAVFVGMRVVGWLPVDNPRAGLIRAWRHGAHAILFRPRRAGDAHSSVAVTSPTVLFEALTRDGASDSGEPVSARRSTPPPLPARASSPSSRPPPLPVAAQSGRHPLAVRPRATA